MKFKTSPWPNKKKLQQLRKSGIDIDKKSNITYILGVLKNEQLTFI